MHFSTANLEWIDQTSLSMTQCSANGSPRGIVAGPRSLQGDTEVSISLAAESRGDVVCLEADVQVSSFQTSSSRPSGAPRSSGTSCKAQQATFNISEGRKMGRVWWDGAHNCLTVLLLDSTSDSCLSVCLIGGEDCSLSTETWRYSCVGVPYTLRKISNKKDPRGRATERARSTIPATNLMHTSVITNNHRRNQLKTSSI